MIPYFAQPGLKLGPLSIHAFGVLVALSVWIGLSIAERRFTRQGLDRPLGERLLWWVLAGGFLGAHLFSAIFYFPEKIAANPIYLFKLWEDISSFGSMLGGLIAIWLFFRLKGAGLSRDLRMRYMDVVAFTFAISLTVGRVGCALAHDHPGTITSFPLAVSMEKPEASAYIEREYREAGRAAELPQPAAMSQLGFHDLGIYELLYLAIVVVPLMWMLNRRREQRAPGFWLGVFALAYLPVRFALDFLRVSDARYAGFTPAQWIALAALLAVAVSLRKGASWLTA
jgi:phosphatidylglycerol---prolipoprotein diacylglyceryl transferase